MHTESDREGERGKGKGKGKARARATEQERERAREREADQPKISVPLVGLLPTCGVHVLCRTPLIRISVKERLQEKVLERAESQALS
eukprot:6188400-Pleurochrysis_carterae.AAC.1